MEEKLLSNTRIGQYIENAWTGENDSGVRPIGDQCLILPDKAVEKTAGGIYLSDSMQESHSIAAETGVVVAIGDGAWSWNMDRTRRFEGQKPIVGQRVCFVRYSGTEIIGDDGEMYRCMTDSCVSGIKDIPVEVAAVSGQFTTAPQPESD